MPKDVQSLLSAAFAALEREALDDAERLFREALEQDTESAAAWHGLGLASSHRGDVATARTCYEYLLARARAQGDRKAEHISLHQLGMVERLAGRRDAALRHLEAEKALIVAHFPEDAVAHAANAYEFGALALGADDPVAARRWFHLALRHAVNAEDAMCLGCAQRGLGDVERAQGRNEAARAAYLASAEAFRNAGDAVALREERLETLKLY